MGKKKVVELSADQRAELEKGYRKGKSHTFRERCQMILLKAENRTSAEVAEILGCCEVVVNNWLKHIGAKPNMNGCDQLIMVRLPSSKRR